MTWILFISKPAHVHPAQIFPLCLIQILVPYWSKQIFAWVRMEAPNDSGVPWFLCLACSSPAEIPVSCDYSTSIRGARTEGNGLTQASVTSTPRGCALHQLRKWSHELSVRPIWSGSDWEAKNIDPPPTPQSLQQSLSGVLLSFEGTPYALLWVHWLVIPGSVDTKSWSCSKTGKKSEGNIRHKTSAPFMTVPAWLPNLSTAAVFLPALSLLSHLMSFFLIFWQEFFFILYSWTYSFINTFFSVPWIL